MSMSIVEAIQSRCGSPVINKIDVNDTHQNETGQPHATDHAFQGAAAAVLVAFYRFGKTDEGASVIADRSSNNWLKTIFMNKDEVAVSRVAGYGNVGEEEARSTMERIADEALREVHNVLGEKTDPGKVKTYMAAQRHSILAYLPAQLEMGKLLNDPALDDRTNKMEGPVSSFMHWIQDLLSPADRTDVEAFRRDDEIFPGRDR